MKSSKFEDTINNKASWNNLQNGSLNKSIIIDAIRYPYTLYYNIIIYIAYLLPFKTSFCLCDNINDRWWPQRNLLKINFALKILSL